ncbi:MAG: glycosyltransferase [Burkholderiaceae bacterium]|nr:glycosyltransferase [Burkholderiaceae bacterium]
MTRRIDVRILTPFGAASGMGNWRTASRYAQMLRATGINASVFERSFIGDACLESGQRTVAIVLNAQRSADDVHTFVRCGIPVMLVMTGTDIYGALRKDRANTPEYISTESAVKAAALIVTLQHEASEEILSRWPELEGRIFTLMQTSPVRKPFAPKVTLQSKTVRFLIAAHIREEKDPRTAFFAFHRAFPEGWAQRWDGGRVPVRLIHVGSHRDRALAQEMLQLSGQFPGILLEGPLTHAQTMRRMTHVHCLIQPSISEGGALVVAEAIACRLPVIASNIAAHRAQLGMKNPGFFEPGDVDGLAAQLTRFIADQNFSSQLCEHQTTLAGTLASPAQERDELVRLVRRLADFLPKDAS